MPMDINEFKKCQLRCIFNLINNINIETYLISTQSNFRGKERFPLRTF